MYKTNKNLSFVHLQVDSTSLTHFSGNMDSGEIINVILPTETLVEVQVFCAKRVSSQFTRLRKLVYNQILLTELICKNKLSC